MLIKRLFIINLLAMKYIFYSQSTPHNR